LNSNRFSRRLAATVVSLLSVGWLVGFVGIQAAHAAACPGVDSSVLNNLTPDCDAGAPATALGGGAAPTVVTDRADGTDSLAHISVIAAGPTYDGGAAEWFICRNGEFEAPVSGPAGADGTLPSTIVGCSTAPIGTDSAPTNPGGVGGADDVFDLLWDVPQQVTIKTGSSTTGTTTIDEQQMEYVAYVCTDTGFTTGCHDEAETNIFTEDASEEGSAADKTTSGEITSPTNGSNVSSGGFRITASTSDDVNSVTFCVSVGDADATDGGTTCTLSITQPSPDSTASGARTWHGDVTAAQAAGFAGQEIHIRIIEATGGSDACATDGVKCQLDAHYANVTRGQQPGDKAFVNFPNQPTTNSANCGSSTTKKNQSTAANFAGQQEAVQGCILDSNGNNVTNLVDWAFTVTPEDTNATTSNNRCFLTSASGTPAPAFGDEGAEIDANSNKCFEAVAGAPGFGATADASLLFFTAGTYTITFCIDGNNNGACDSGELAATGTKTVSANGDTLVDLIDTTEHAQANNGQCTNGSTNVQAKVGTTVHVTECVTDRWANPLAGASVSWVVGTGSGPRSGSYTRTDNVTDSTGHATADFAGGSPSQQAFLFSCATSTVAESPSGNPPNHCSNNTVIVNWQGQASNKSGTHLSLSKTSRLRLFGTLTANNPNICGTGGRRISLYIVTKNGSVLIDVTTTAGGGTFHFRLHRAKRTHDFFARFRGSPNCGASKSNEVHSRAKA